MALYHFSVRHVSRGKGQMVVTSAAYISGQRIYDGYYNRIHDYTSKSGVVFTEILTPEYVPERLTDRETLWNEVEHVERNNRAQLAYSFDIALQNELTLEENIRLAKEFCQEQFVVRGMIVDLAVHEGKSDNEEEPDNSHFHVLAPIRPFTEEGIWGNKQRREYILDEDGNRVKDAKGKDMFNAISTTGWNDPELLKEWRRAWTEKVNGKFRECHMAARIDHHSYKEQGIDLIPTIHEGYEVRAMEKKGIKTVIGELNRAIRQFNQMIISLKESMVYRFGHVVGDSETGVCNDGDFIFRIIKSCLILGAYPDIKGSIAPIAIDDVAKIVVGISQIEDQYGKTYHVINTKKISFQDAVDIVDRIGICLQPLEKTNG